MNTLFVGLGHYSGVGKDESAKILAKYVAARGGLTVRIASFADKLKEIAYEIWKPYGMQPKAFYELNRDARDIPLPVINKTPVQLWVEFGTIYAREVSYDGIWLDHMAHLGETAQVIVIPDLRFPNEARWIQGKRGLHFKVLRQGVDPRDTVADHALSDWVEWDGVIGNHGDLNQLHLTLNSRVHQIIRQYHTINQGE